MKYKIFLFGSRIILFPCFLYIILLIGCAENKNIKYNEPSLTKLPEAFQELNLTDQQKTKIRNIYKSKKMEQLNDVRDKVNRIEDQDPEYENLLEEMDRLKKEVHGNIKRVLNSDQNNKLEELEKNRKFKI